MFSWWGSNKETGAEESKRKEGGQSEKTESVENDSTSQSDTTGTAKDLANNFGSYLYSVASVATLQTAVKVIKDTVKQTVEGKDILADFNKEQEKFVNEKHSKRKETGVPPWVGYHEEETMKSQILALSSDERNFLRDPPAGVEFIYDYDSMFPIALATLDEDPELKSMRFNLVPKKVKETTFWRNYFYRVSLIKQSSQLTSLASTTGTGNVSGLSENQTKNNQLNTEVSPGASQTKPEEIGEKGTTENPNDDLGDIALSSSPTHVEFISDAYEGSQVLSKEDLEQIGVERLKEKKENTQITSKSSKEAPNTSKSNPVTGDKPTDSQQESNLPDWERELQEELQEYDVVVNEEGGGDDDDDGSWEKEIEDMLEADVS